MASNQPRCKLEPDRIIHGSRLRCSNYDPTHHPNRNYDRVAVGVLAVITAFGGPVQANTTVANPSSTSSGSVVNNAYQMMTGPHPIYRMSQGIQCPGPTLSLSPFVTSSRNFDLPHQSVTRTPVYSSADADDNGEPDSPGKVLYYSEMPRFEKDRRSVNYGITATFSMPLDGGLTARCKRAVETNIELQQQLLATKRLEYELFRAKQCGQLAESRIQFRPGSRYAQVCEDIVVYIPPKKVIPHVHSISAPSADSSDAQK